MQWMYYLKSTYLNPTSLLQNSYLFAAITEKKGSRSIFTEWATSFQETLIMTPLGKALLVQFDLSDVQREFLQSIAPSQLMLKDALALPNVDRKKKQFLFRR